ncbi:hypothetical protein B1207_10770 [Legionella quinlivanii]|uniref:Uncharacterized protein n=1 Tax=Legionella quinlivanii TaxID=45073 RepID=A0A364LI68_9GAMM|nr:EAL domain-containing response regulator [Legionella quinlivanii]RAP36046.1 hypothetical protein B1207_10770 [Legionella quinlivanii]
MSNRLLILDDDVMICKTIQNIARFTDIEAEYTTNPATFLDQVQTWEPEFLAIDLIMPEMDGIQVMTELARHHCTSKILITSGVGSRVLDAAQRTAYEHGLNVVAVLPKPFSLTDLRKLLTQLNTSVKKPPSHYFGLIDKNPELLLKSDLSNALEQKEIYVVYQPKIDCKTQELKGFEVLSRWVNTRFGIVQPDRFIPFAESCHLIDGITYEVLDQALHWFSEITSGPVYKQYLPEKTIKNLKLSVNISTSSLKNTALFEQLSKNIKKLGLEPNCLILELTETAAMEDPVASLEILTRLRMQGFELSIDDFGTGFSSMLQLVRLPFSEIKIDKSFVINAKHSLESKVVIKSIVDLGKSLGLQTTAEGLEDKDTLSYLCEIGCDQAQGYYISHPLVAKEILEWIKSRSIQFSTN